MPKVKQLKKNKEKVNGPANKQACFVDNPFYYRVNDGSVKTRVNCEYKDGDK
jgi:hypothetical protein